MKKLTGMLLIGLAVLLYLTSAITFFSYMYTFTIRDTVSAIESAFGTLVILVAMLILAKFSLAAGKTRLREARDHGQGEGQDQESTGN